MRTLIAFALLLAASAASLRSQDIPSLPDETGWGVHVLALELAPDGAIWVGTYGQGIFVLRPGARDWEHIADDDTEGSISWGFVHAFAFGSHGEVWYGTLGNGWGYSTDGGSTWKNWTFQMLGPEYQYVAPNGIVTRGDTVYVATADGVKLTWDMGETWSEITDSIGTLTASNVWSVIGNQYVLAISSGSDGSLWLSHVHGIERSTDGGRTWDRFQVPQGCSYPVCHDRARALVSIDGNWLMFGTERGTAYYLRRRAGYFEFEGIVLDLPEESAVQRVAHEPLLAATELGVTHIGSRSIDSRIGARRRFASSMISFGSGAAGWLLVGGPLGLDAVGPGAPQIETEPPAAGYLAGEAPADPRHTWFDRPVSLDDQPYIDQTYRYGSTMGGNFQQHQGVEFNAGAGTPVYAIGDGVVAYAADAEAGSRTVVIRHDRTLEVGGQEYFLYSAYYHNSKVMVEAGQRVQARHPISRIGNTGRATNDHLHLEVHATPVDSLGAVVDPEQRYPPHSTNPELWIAPLPGTGIVAGRVWDGDGNAVGQARIYGLIKGEPQETPFSFVETYGDRTRGTPAYGEHFALGDVPPGDYVIGVNVDGERLYRRVQVEEGKVTWVVFRP